MLPNKSSLNMLKFLQAYKRTIPRFSAAIQTPCWSRSMHHVGNQRLNDSKCKMTNIRCTNAMSALGIANRTGFQNVNPSRQCHNGKEPRKHIMMSPWRALETSARMYLFKYFLDKKFQIKPFVDGTIQAFIHVSKCLAAGEHEELEGLLTPEVMRKVYSHTVGTPSAPIYAVDESDIVHMFISNVDVKNDAENDRRIEIMAVFVFKKNYERDFKRATTFDAVAQMPSKLDFSNYRFVRHYRGNEPTSDWRINYMCHFTFQDIVPKY